MRRFPVFAPSPFLLALALLLAAAAPARAVLRAPDADPMHDTLVLLPDEAREFRFKRLAGADLNQAGIYLALAAPLLALAAAPLYADYDPTDAYLLIGYVGLPAAAALMAGGNLIYAEAARYHVERDYPITHSLLPVASLALATGKAAWWLVQGRSGLEDSSPWEVGLTLVLACSELLAIPALRSQLNAASVFLEQVEVRVTGQGPRLGLRVPF